MDRTPKPKIKKDLIAADLRQKIRSRKLPPGTQLPSAQELASRYKVCMMTANEALDILVQESLIVRQRGRGNFVRENVLRGRKMLLGIADVIEHSDNYARNILIDVFPEAAIACFKAENCDCRVIPYLDFRERNMEVFQDLDGLLLSSNFVDETTMEFIQRLKLPIVIYRAEYEMDFPWPQVIPDHSVAMNQLFTLAEQEKVPGILIFCHQHANGRARCRAFEFYAKKHNFTNKQIRSFELTPLDLHRKVMELLAEIPSKLLITCSDLMTFELIRICSENGLVCGRDYLLVSYDNLSKSMELPRGIPGVTSIDYSRTAAGKTAARLLIQNVRKPNQVSYQTIKFLTRLNIRESAFQNRKELVTL